MVSKASSAALLTVTAATILAGFGLAALTLSITSMIAVLVVGGTIAGTVHCVLLTQPQALGPPAFRYCVATRMQTMPWWCTVAYGAVLLGSLAGFMTILGPVTSLALLGVVVTLRLGFVIRQKTRTRGPAGDKRATRTALGGARPEPSGTADSASAALLVPEDLMCWSDGHLCWAWRVSYGQLAHAHGHHLEQLALQRRHYLDELERRHPTGFAAWISHGARAPSNPARYLASPTHPGPHVPGPHVPGDPEHPTGVTTSDP